MTVPELIFVNKAMSPTIGSPWVMCPSCVEDIETRWINSPNSVKQHFPKEKSYSGRQNHTYPQWRPSIECLLPSPRAGWEHKTQLSDAGKWVKPWTLQLWKRFAIHFNKLDCSIPLFLLFLLLLLIVLQISPIPSPLSLLPSIPYLHPLQIFTTLLPIQWSIHISL